VDDIVAYAGVRLSVTGTGDGCAILGWRLRTLVRLSPLMRTDIVFTGRVFVECRARARIRRRGSGVPARPMLLTLVTVGAGLSIYVIRVILGGEAAKSFPVIALAARDRVAIGFWNIRVYVPPAIREAGHHIFRVAFALDHLTHFSARELEVRDAPRGLSQISSVDRERLVLA